MTFNLSSLVFALFLASCLFLSCVRSYETQDVAKVASATGPELHYSKHHRMWNNYNITGYLAVIDNPRQFFKILYPHASSTNSTCAGYMLTTEAAEKAGCLYATNAGPFNTQVAADSCMGYVVSDSVVVLDQSTNNAAFGLTKAGKWIIGSLTTAQVKSLDFAQLVSGFNWLVRLGNVTDIAEGGEIAPRTTIGTDSEGRLLIFEADGAEVEYIGLTMLQTAKWMKDLGGYNVINLDGGGSSVTYYNGKMVSKPSCHDTTSECERAVTTITCVMPGSQ